MLSDPGTGHPKSESQISRGVVSEEQVCLYWQFCQFAFRLSIAMFP